MSKVICVIQQGTSFSRAILFDEQFNIVAKAQTTLECDYPHPTWVNQDANKMFESVQNVVSEALTQANLNVTDLAGISIVNQRETTIMWDKVTQDPIAPALVWQSRQSAFYCEDMKKKGYVPFVKKRTGLMIDAIFSASKIRFILDEHSECQEKAECGNILFGTVDTWLIYKLTNGKVHVTDVTNASRTLLMNIDTCEWDEKLCDIWNIPMHILPKIVDNNEIVGYTDKAVFGAEVPIASVIASQHASLFGQMAIKKGDVKNTYGTGCFLLMNTGNEKVISKQGLVSTIAWRKNKEVTYALEGSVFSAGEAIFWLRDGLRLIESAGEVESLSRSVQDDEGVVFVPAFVGLGAPYWRSDLKAAMFGITRSTSIAHIVRASVEALAFQSYDMIKLMELDSNMKVNKILVDGEFSKYDFLLEFQAGILNVDVVRPKIHETAAFGGAMMAALSLGWVKSMDELEKVFSEEKVFTSKLSLTQRSEALKHWKDSVSALLSYKEYE